MKQIFKTFNKPLITLYEYMTYHSKSGLYTNYYNSLCEFFDKKLNPKQISIVDDLILETLNIHDRNKLIKKLKQKYNNILLFEHNSQKESFWIGLKDIKENILTNDKKFINLLNFYGYYCSQTKYISKYKTMFYYIAPTYSKNVNDLVYKENHGILYHFTVDTEFDTKESILRNGLRIKKNTYREYPERIYCYSSFKYIKNNNNFTDNFKEFIYKNINYNQLKNKIYIFKIDLNKLKNYNIINFYNDDSIDDKNSVYTYTNIPNFCISYIGEIDAIQLINDYLNKANKL